MLWLKKGGGGGHSELLGCLAHSTICMKRRGISRGLPIGGGVGVQDAGSAPAETIRIVSRLF